MGGGQKKGEAYWRCDAPYKDALERRAAPSLLGLQDTLLFAIIPVTAECTWETPKTGEEYHARRGEKLIQVKDRRS